MSGHEHSDTNESTAEALLGHALPPRARAVVEAFLAARRESTGFLLSCGLLPEVSESCTESLHHHVHTIAEAFLGRQQLVEELHAAVRQHVAGRAFDDVEHAVTALVAADATAAYLFGLAAGLGLGSLDRRLTG